MLYFKTIEEIAFNYARQLGVSIEFNNKNAFSTPNKIVLPKLKISDANSERLLYGLMAHEAGHIHFSDFGLFSTINNPIMQEMVNALEDCRIEYLMGQRYTGALENLNYVSQCIYRMHWEQFHDLTKQCKLKLIIRYLILQVQAQSLNYYNAKELALLFQKQLKCLINPNKIELLDKFLPLVIKQKDTQGIYDLVCDIYNLFYTKDFFVPNFESFVLANNTISTFDLNNAKALAKYYGQDFHEPVLGPNKEIYNICSCQELIDQYGLDATEQDLNENFVPNFIAPLFPEFNNNQINLHNLVKEANTKDILSSQNLANQAAGNLQEASFLCKNKIQRSRIYNHNFPLLDVTEQLAKLSHANIEGNQPTTSKSLPTKVDNKKFAPLDNRFNPLYGAFKDQKSFIKAIDDYKALLDSYDHDEFMIHNFINYDFSYLEHDMGYSSFKTKKYHQLGRPNLSLELTTRIVLERLANPMRYQTALLWTNVPAYYPISEKIQNFMSIQELRMEHIKELRNTKINAPTQDDEIEQLNEQTLKKYHELSQHYSLASNMTCNLDMLREQCSDMPTFRYDHSSLEFDLLHLDESFNLKEISVKIKDQMILSLIERRKAAQFQRHEAILKELNLYDKRNIDPILSIDPNLYCKDSSGNVYLKYYYKRSLVAKDALLKSGLNYSHQAIPKIVDRNFYVPISNYYRINRKSKSSSKKDDGLQYYFDAPEEHYLQELFKDPLYISSWSQEANPQSDNNIAGTKSLTELEAQYDSLPINVRRDNTLYQRYIRFLNNLFLTRENDQLYFHNELIDSYQHCKFNLRDPRAENTFADALREYYFTRYNKQKSSLIPQKDNNITSAFRNDVQQAIIQVLGQNDSDDTTRPWGVDYRINMDMLRDRDFVSMLLSLDRDRNLQTKDWLYAKPYIENALGYENIQALSKDLINKEQQIFVKGVKQNLKALRMLLEHRLSAYITAKNNSSNHGKELQIRKAQFILLGENKIFKQKNFVLQKDTLVHLLVDVSSSMSDKQSYVKNNFECEYNNAGYIACQSALNIALSLENLDNIGCEVTYFPGAIPQKPCLTVLYEHEKASDMAPFFLQIPRFYTPTAKAIEYTLNRMSGQEYERKIIILITDGMPDKPQDTINAMCKAKQQSVEFYSIGIFDDRDVQKMVKFIFPDIHSLDDFHQLPKVLSKIIADRFTI